MTYLPFRWLYLLSLLSLCLSAGATTAPLGPLRQLAAGGARVSALAVDLPDGKVVARLDAGDRLGAASLTKLFIAAAALKTWGPYKTFTTRIFGPTPHEGVVNGDLVFVGGGDPTLTYGGLWQLATQLSEAGIRRINGNLVINQSLFGNIACQSDDRCNAKNRSRYAYDSPLSAAGINFATWCVAVAPADRAGSPAHVRLCQLTVPDIALVGHINTTAKGRPNRVNVSRVSKAGRERLLVSGDIAADSPVLHIYRSTANAPLQTGQIFREILRRSGINITGNIQISSAPVADLPLLAKAESITLTEQLTRMMTYSNNYMADTLALDLLADNPHAQRPLTLKAAGRQLLALNAIPGGGETGAPVIHSGSGLTPENALSAADIVALLKNMYLRTDLFPAFTGSLTVPEFSPLTIFRGTGSGWRTRIAAKTGSMQDPVTVLGVAGYFRKPDGNWGAFALLINGTDKRPHIPFDEGTRALRETVNRLLKVKTGNVTPPIGPCP